MCELCQMQFGFDHKTPRRGHRVCPRCGRFYIQPQNKTCYHCWAKAGIAERCDRCLVEGPPPKLKPLPPAPRPRR